ncbi:phage shock protein PspA [Thalassotalea sp. Y01]|uniref:phage shock protein PspA n=1 Tax=Thalassotalea sp. Y01 TaxID=2729613 RepID=UPI00145EE51F|nr:phage shock protein PspA [Thalassotalea sp. Y01]NMP17242.1 phage shock protein PspA [Thalassotalea sp. Y01]
MGMFSRITDIINANINALLDKAENPEKMIRLIIQEMEETLVEVRSEAAKHIAEKKHLSRNLRNVQNKESEWQQKAEIALAKGREDLARGALIEKQKVATDLENLQQQVQHIDEVLEKIQDDSNRLQEKLTEAKQRQQAFNQRQQSAEVRLQAKKVLDSSNIDSAIAKFESYQQKVDELEAQVESYDFVASKSLSQQIAELEQDDEVEQQLEMMKKKVANG